jgi:polysaccharide biosynthesis protein PslH
MITLHNRLSGMIAADLARAPGRRQRWFRARDLAKAQRLERWIARTYDRCVTCSAQDAAALAELAQPRPERAAVIPNGVDPSLFSGSPVPPEPRILLPARLAYGPNVDGAVWFCTTVWPAVRAAVPEASLVLAGRSPLPEVLALERLPGVTVQADVPSMVPYFEAARVVIVPVRIGTGTRLKALEGMAAGRPVVGTGVGLEGIEVQAGRQALIADEPEALAAAVVQVLAHDDLAQRLADAGRTHVQRDYAWDRIGLRFVDLVSELLASANADGQVLRAAPRPH